VDQSDRPVRAARQALEDSRVRGTKTVDLRDFDPPAADVVVINDVTFRRSPLRRALAPARARAASGRAPLPPGEGRRGRLLRGRGGLMPRDVVPGHRGRHPSPPGRRASKRFARHGFSVRDRTVKRAASPAWVLLEAVRHPAAAERA
jgi:hypothetical protein